MVLKTLNDLYYFMAANRNDQLSNPEAVSFTKTAFGQLVFRSTCALFWFYLSPPCGSLTSTESANEEDLF